MGKKSCNPADKIIKLFGGALVLAEELGISPSTVYRWAYPVGENNGTGGIIPHRYHKKIIASARSKVLDIKITDLHPEV